MSKYSYIAPQIIRESKNHISQINEKTAILFSHSARIRCILNNFTVTMKEGTRTDTGRIMDLMSFLRNLVSKDKHNKFQNCACILIKKLGSEYYFYLIHNGDGNDKRHTKEKIKVSFDDTDPDSIIGFKISPKNNIDLRACFEKYTNLLIVRHGEGWHNVHSIKKKFSSSPDKWNSPLTDRGIEQSRAAGNTIKKIFTAQEYDIFASVLRRTAETAFHFIDAFVATQSPSTDESQEAAISTKIAFFSQHPIYIIPCNDELNEDSTEDCNKSYNQLNPEPCTHTMWKCQNTENRLKDTDVFEPYIPPDIFNTSGMIKGHQYHVFSGILFAECRNSVFSYLDPELVSAHVLNPVLNFAQNVITGRVDGGSLKKNKKKRRKTLRRKSKRFTKKRNSRRTNKKKRLTNKRRTNKKRFTKRR